MSEFDSLKDDAEKEAKDHPQQVQEAEHDAEHAVESKFGDGDQSQGGQQNQGGQQSAGDQQGGQQNQGGDSGQDANQQNNGQ